MPNARISTLAIAFVRSVTASASRTARVAQQVRHVAERHLGEQRDEREGQEGQRDADGEGEQRREAGAPEGAASGIIRAAAARTRRRFRTGGPAVGAQAAMNAPRPALSAPAALDDAGLVAHRRLGPARERGSRRTRPRRSRPSVM